MRIDRDEGQVQLVSSNAGEIEQVIDQLAFQLDVAPDRS